MNGAYRYIGIQRPTYVPSVPWIPTRDDVIDRVLSLANFNDKDLFCDLGCGDGRVVIRAAREYNVKCLCIEKREDLVKKAIINVKRSGVEDLVKVIHADFFDVSLRDATVVYMYLLTSVNRLLRPKLERELKLGTRIITLDFEIPGWTPIYVEGGGGWQGTIYLYIKGISDVNASRELNNLYLPLRRI